MGKMIQLAVRGIRASLGRLILTTIAIVAGVGFVSGAFILADSLSDTFTSLFENASSTVDARVTVAEPEFGDDLRTLSDDLTATVAALPEVDEATPEIGIDANTNAKPFIVLDADGEPVEPRGPPIITFSWDGSEVEDLILLADGVPPVGLDQVAIDSTYAAAAGVAAGDVVTLATPDGERQFTLTGTVDLPITGGAYFVLFDFPSAQVLYDKEGQVDAISVTRSPGTSTEDMIAAIEEVIPPEGQVQTQAEIVDEDVADFETIINGLRTGLLVFAGIALFVSLFIIYNTFAILVNQRLHQIGMLRAIGATRGQIRISVLMEAVLVGIIGSIIGIVFGLAVAIGIKALFQAGGGFPETGTVIAPRTILVAILVGLVATVVSALLPAFLAGRVSPVAAMRNEAPSRSSRTRRTIIGAVVLGTGLALFLTGLLGTGGSFSSVASLLGLGAILIFVGVALLSVLFAGPVVGVIGRAPVLAGTMLALGLGLPILMFTVGDGLPDGILSGIAFVVKLAVSIVAVVTGGSIALGLIQKRRTRFGGAAAGVEGQLARQNAARAPQRTAATATALTIGIALVSTVGVVGESFKASLAQSLERAFQADIFVYDEQGGFFTSEVADRIEGVDGLAALSRFRVNEIRLGEDDVVGVAAYNAETGEDLIAFDVSEGSTADLGDNGILVFRDEADERSLNVGQTLSVEFPDLETEELTIVGIFEDNSGLGTPWIIDLAVYERHITLDDDLFVAASVADGFDPETVQAEIQTIVSDYGSVNAESPEELTASRDAQIDTLTSLINYLLGFALFIAFLGVINTIVLSVIERTREIGLLRAVGMTRVQTRSTIRWESVIVCLFGALVGIVLGTLFAWAAVTAIPDFIISTVAIPYESVLFTILVAALAGVLAAVLPARRAARMEVLDAIATTE